MNPAPNQDKILDIVANYPALSLDEFLWRPATDQQIPMIDIALAPLAGKTDPLIRYVAGGTGQCARRLIGRTFILITAIVAEQLRAFMRVALRRFRNEAHRRRHISLEQIDARLEQVDPRLRCSFTGLDLLAT